MKKTFLFALILFFCGIFKSQEIKPELVKYVDFLNTQNTSAKDYVLSLFKNYDVVILCERHHGETTQYDLINSIISSDYFINNVGNVFQETGSISTQKEVLHFIKTKFSSAEAMQKEQVQVCRDISFIGWEKTNFYNFIGKLNDLNYRLPNNKKVNLYVSDARLPSKKEQNSEEKFLKYFNETQHHRDSIMAKNIIEKFSEIQKKSDRKKCLVIMNYRHAFSKTYGEGYKNTGHILFEKYRNKIANVYINSVSVVNKVVDSTKAKIYQDYHEELTNDGKWDASFKLTKKENLGFDLANSPFGKDSFDVYPFEKNQDKFSQVFTGFIFYLPIEKHSESYGIPNFLNNYLDEYYRRNKIWFKALKKEVRPKEEMKHDFDLSVETYDDFDKLISQREKWLK